MVRGSLAFVVVAIGCSGRAVVPSEPADPVVPVGELPADPEPLPPYTLPAAEAPPASTVQCEDLGEPDPASPTWSTKKPQSKTYEFAEVSLSSTVLVPTVAERPLRGPRRTPALARRMISRDAIEGCWRWARVRGDLDSTRVELSFRIDPFGRVADVDATSTTAGTDALSACIEEQLGGSGTSLGTTWTHVTAALHLWASPEDPKTKPARPEAPAKWKRGKLCTPVLSEVPDDEIVLPVPLELDELDDYVAYGCGDRPELDKRTIRAAMRTNQGAFGACHAAARARDPQLSGAVVLEWRLDHDAAAQDIKVSGAGDDAFHDCMRAALAEIGFPSWGPVVRSTWTFTLDAPTATPSDDPDVLLEARDPDAALAIWERRLDDDPRSPDACAWRAGVLRAMIVRAPWIDDARLRGAVADLVRHAATLDDGAAGSCLETVSSPLVELLRVAHNADDPARFFWEWQEPMAILELLWPVRAHLSEELTKATLMGRAFVDPDAVIQELEREAAGHGRLSVWAREQAARLREVPDVMRRVCQEGAS